MSNRSETHINSGTYLAQTEKHISKLGGADSREYVTLSSPDGTIPHFNKFVPDGAYAEALSGKVIQCVDIMVHDPETGRVLIGRRDQEPHSGDWVIGGAMRAGESVAQAAARNMQRELRVDIDQSRLSEVGNYKFIWDSRAQGSTINQDGEVVDSCHMSSTLELYPVREADIRTEDFNDEYDELKWVDVIDIVNAPEGTYHPCLVDMVWDMLEKETYPTPPKDVAEAIDRHLGAIAYLRTQDR